MSSVKQQLYDVALDGQGYVLVGDPQRPALSVKQQPVFGNRFSQGDRDFQDLSFWWFAAQRDFTGGVKELNIFADDSKWYTGTDLDTFSQKGFVQAFPGQTTVNDFGTTSFLALNSGAFDVVGGTPMILQGVQGKTSGDKSLIYKSTNGSSFTDVTAAGSPTDGKSWKQIMRYTMIDKFIIVRNDSSWTFSTYNGTTHADVTAAVQGADSMSVGDGAAEAGGRMWAFFRDASSPAALIIKSSTDAATWTKRVTIPGGFFLGGVDIGGDLIYVIDYGFNTVQLRKYDVSADVDSLLHRWIGQSITLGTGREVRGGAIATADGQNGYIIFDNGEIWKYDGASVARVFENTASQIPSAIGFGFTVHDGRIVGPNVVIDTDGSIHAGPNLPVGGVAGKVWPMFTAKFSGDTQTFLWSRDDSSSSTRVRLAKHSSAVDGVIEMNMFDGNVPNIDKLFREVSLVFEKFNNSSQSFTVQYKKDDETSFTNLGTVSQPVNGNISSFHFDFSDGFIAKTLSIRIRLQNEGLHSQRPKLKTVILRYLPVPNYALKWDMTLNCSDRITLKDGKTEEPKTGEWLRNLLRTSWWNRTVVPYEDLDGETVLLNGELTSSATTIPVRQGISNMPERGRVKIEDEEILYSGKNQTQLLNCTRGARGTIAATHSDLSEVTTRYDVIIVNYSEQVIVANRPKDREYRVTVSLLEA